MRYTLEELKNKFTYDPKTGNVTALNTGRWGNKSRIIRTINSDRYYKFNWKLHGKHVQMLVHRIAWELHNNELLGDRIIDHIDHDKLNNKPDNLRACTRAENNKNLDLKCNNKLGVHNVEQLSSGNYRARITVNGKRIPLGTFKNLEDAKKAKLEANIKYGFHKNHK